MEAGISLNPIDHDGRWSLFGQDAAGYHAGRIGYPDALYDLIFARTVSAPDVIEIGAGTGLVTEALLTRSVRSVTSVEPAAELVAFMRGRLPDPRLTIATTAFPDAGTIDGRFDLGVCAAAFHWMEPAAALARVRTLLRPGGIWAVWWHSYRNFGVGDPLADAITRLLEGISLPPSDSLTRHYSLDIALHTRLLISAGFVDIEHHVFRHERMMSARQVRTLYASYSYVRALPATRRNALLDAIESSHRNTVWRMRAEHRSNVALHCAFS